MDKELSLPAIKLSELREDVPEKKDNEGFWDNVSEHSDGYIITSRVKGV